MNDYYFEIYLTGVPECHRNTDELNFFDNIAEQFYPLFGEDGSPSICENNWSISITENGHSLEYAVQTAVKKIKTLGYGVSRIVFDTEVVERFCKPELVNI